MQQLRSIAANFIRSNQDDFMPFMDEIENEVQFNKYCEDTEHTSAWGGQLEVRKSSFMNFYYRVKVSNAFKFLFFGFLIDTLFCQLFRKLLITVSISLHIQCCLRKRKKVLVEYYATI